MILTQPESAVKAFKAIKRPSQIRPSQMEEAPLPEHTQHYWQAVDHGNPKEHNNEPVAASD